MDLLHLLHENADLKFENLKLIHQNKNLELEIKTAAAYNHDLQQQLDPKGLPF